MITTRACTVDDGTAVAALWNSKTLDAESCWYQAMPVNAAYVSGLLAGGYTLVLALDGATPVGFALWCGPVELPRLVAIAADATQAYYRLMAEFCAWGLAAGAASGYAEIDARPTTERARMDALGVITYRPVGFEPLAPGAEAQNRVPRLYWAECDLSALNVRLGEVLGASS